MLRRDFIMVQIEELGKVIAQIVSQRNTDAARKTPELIQGIYTSLKIDPKFLLSASPAEVRNYLNGDDGEGIRRMEIAAKALIEESYLYPDRKKEILLKSKELLTYIQAHDATFSLERINLLEEINNRLAE